MLQRGAPSTNQDFTVGVYFLPWNIRFVDLCHITGGETCASFKIPIFLQQYNTEWCVAFNEAK